MASVFKSRFVVEAIDAFSSPFKSISGSAGKATQAFKETTNALKSVNEKLKKVDGYNAAITAAKRLKAEQAKQISSMASLQKAIQQAGGPNRELKLQYKAAERELTKLQDRHKKATVTVRELSAALAKEGISKKNASSETAKLRAEEERLNKSLTEQKPILDSLVERQKKITSARASRDKSLQRSANLTIAGQGAMQQGLGILSAFSSPMQEAMGFESAVQAAAVKVGGGGSLEDRKKQFSAIAIKLGQDTEYTTTSVSQAISLLGQAGVDARNISTQSVSQLLDIARAGELDLEETTAISTSVISSFGLDFSKDLGTVGDTLVTAANISTTSVSEMAEVFKQAAAPANILGVNLQQMSGMIAIMANNGIRGSVAGTALKNTLLSFTKPSKEASKVFKNLNISLTDASGSLKKPEEIFMALAQATKNLPDPKRLAMFESIVGREGLAGFTTLVQEAGKSGTSKFAIDLDKAGISASKFGQDLKNTTAFQLEQFSGTLSTLKITLGTLLLPMLSAFATKASNVLGVVTTWAQENQGLAKGIMIAGTAIGVLTIAGGALAVSLGTIAGGLASATFILKTFGASSLFAQGGVLALAKSFMGAAFTMRGALIASGVGSGILAIAGLATLVIQNWDSVKSFFVGLWETVSEVFSNIWNVIEKIFPPLKMVSDLFPNNTKTQVTASAASAKAEQMPWLSSLPATPKFLMQQPSSNITPTVNVTINGNADPKAVASEIEKKIKEIAQKNKVQARAAFVDAGG